MIKITKENRESILQKIQKGAIDAAMLSTTSLVDDVILTMHHHGITNCLKNGFKDKRADNCTVPFDLILTLAIAAKMKVHTSLTDIPFALTDHRTICELGYSLWDTNRDINTGLMTEGTIRALIGKYTPDDLIKSYVNTVQNHIIPHMDISPNIHMIDGTKLDVNINNYNYEGAKIVVDSENNALKGYNLVTLRGIYKDTGIIEDIRISSANQPDINLGRDIMLNSPVLKSGDILIGDRGFMDRKTMNILETERGVHTYIPIRDNMEAYELAVSTAIYENNWHKHPNKKRHGQMIALVNIPGIHWDDKCSTTTNVDLNACVTWYVANNSYSVIVTTDTTKTAKQITQIYELRGEIEEDYRQLKNFWKLKDFKSTKLHLITFHIICVLLGYLFFQLYTMLPEGEQWNGESLPIVLKNYQSNTNHHVVIYADDVFGVLTILEIAQLYSRCSPEIQEKLADILKLI